MKNAVNRAFMAKKKYIVLGLLMTFALSVSARMYPKGDVIFVNVQQSDAIGNWAKDNAKLFVYFYQGSNSSNNAWVSLSPIRSGSTMYYGKMPSGKAPWFDKAQIKRQSPSGAAWNESVVMDIPDDKRWNCIVNFNDAGNRWKLYTPDVSSLSTFIASETAEVISVCDSAAGNPISLRPKLKIIGGEKVGYLYENVYGYAWYKSVNGITWVGEKSYAGNYRNAGQENVEDKDLFETLPKPIPAGGIYYYLFSTLTEGCRLVHVLPNATDCELDCEITAFETAISAVNADDNTYTLDGMVAFGKPNGNLIIECDGKSIVIASDTIHSPQSFSLHGVPAATTDGKKTKAYAYFTGNTTACRDSVTVDVPNATKAIDKVTMDSLTGKQFVLTPLNIESSNKYVWLMKNEATGQLDTLHGASQVLTLDAFSVDTALTLVYKEYYPAAGNMDDMMDNGGYEDNESEFNYGTKGEKSTISEYNYWGYYEQTENTQINFYTDTCPTCINPAKLQDNGFAVVRNSNNFYPTYAKVKALEGSNFGLFDAVSGKRGGNKRAWEATTAKNSKLKLKKGTTYVLSFWAANINNYGEMDNAAKFRFYIEDITDINNPVRLDSSQMLDLSQPEYHNNLWHQCSKTFTAKKDYNNVRISVVNKNLDSLHIGNDFALDDIQFHPISSVSKVVKSQQEFKVYAHEPKIDAFTATVQPVDCDETDYTIAMHVEYQNNPSGQLFIRDATRDTIYKYDLPAMGAFDTPYTFDRTIVIKTKEPMHTWEAYFENWPAAKKSVVTDIPGFPKVDTLNIAFSEPSCGDLTTTLTFDLKYTYQQGQLHYTITELSGDSTAATTVSPTEQTLAGLRFNNIPADGKVRHLHVWWDGPNSCDTTYTLPAVPFSPVIDNVTIVSSVPDTVSCSTTSYTIDVAVKTHYDPTGLGKNIVLHYDNGNEQKDTTVLAAAQTTTISGLTLFNIDDTVGMKTIYAELAGYSPVCPDSVKYKAPVHAHIHPFDVTVGETACGVTNYTLSGTIPFDKADGNLVVQLDAAHSQTIPVAAGSKSANFSLSGIDSIGTNIQLKAWFTNSAGAACEVLSNPFDAPSIPRRDIFNIAFSEPTCTDKKTSLTFDLNYTYQQGRLHYTIVELTGDSTVVTTASQTEQTLSGLRFDSIPADGKVRHLHVWWDGANSCDTTYTLPAVPYSPVIAKVDTNNVPKTVLCDAQDYPINVIVRTPYDATGKNIVLSYEGNTTTVAATGTETTVPLTLTTIGGANLTIDAAYEGAACPASASITFATPARISCNKLDTTICDKQTVTWMGHTYSGHVGLTDTITNPENVYDTLLLTVVAIPHLTIAPIAMTCNEEVAIRFPYSDPIGDPDSCTIVIGGQNYPLTMDGATDELVLNINPMLKPGDYVGSLTVGRAGVSCTSDTTVSIRIAIANQMFVKWNDVIFISNKGNLYTAYQWYKDGVEMPGETQQRLYDPTGLQGTTAEYYCRMLRNDGKYIYTCPQAFDDIQRSADQSTDTQSQQQIISTFRVSPHVYIIRIQTGDRVETKKIMRYE